MHVLHVITGLQDGGAEAVLARLCLHDRAHSHAVVSLTDVGKYGPILCEAGTPIYCLNMRAGRVSMRGVRSLWRILRSEQPDVVQTWMYHADFVGGLVARLARIKTISWGVRQTDLEPGTSKRSTIWVARACARLSSWVPQAIVCCADSAVRVHSSIGYDQRKLLVVHNGYDLNEFRPDANSRFAVREELGIPPCSRVIGMVGRFDPQKDHETLLNALDQLDLDELDAYCVLVGNEVTSRNQKLIDWIQARGLGGRIILLGQRTDVPALMNALDVHVLSSAFGEGFPNVLAEAMACGTPCVATDVGDASFIVGDTGWIVPPKNPGALAAALAAALRDHSSAELWRRRQESARARIEQRFSIESMVRGFHDVWVRLARG